jgi:hypothetical protein
MRNWGDYFYMWCAQFRWLNFDVMKSFPMIIFFCSASKERFFWRLNECVLLCGYRIVCKEGRKFLDIVVLNFDNLLNEYC